MTLKDDANTLRRIAANLDAAAGDSGTAGAPAGEASPTAGTPAEGPSSPVAGAADTVTVQADESGQPESLEQIAEALGVDHERLVAYNAGHLGTNPAPAAGTVLAVPPDDANAQTAESDQPAGAPSSAEGQAATPQDTAAAEGVAPTPPTGSEPAATQEAPTDGNS